MPRKASAKKRNKTFAKPPNTKSSIPSDVVELIACLRKENIDYTANPIEFSRHYAKLQRVCSRMIGSIVQNPQKYGSVLLRLRNDLQKASETMFVCFIKRYNTMVDVSNSGDDKGWTPASVLFVVFCQCRYLSELCETASLVLYGRDGGTKTGGSVSGDKMRFLGNHGELDQELDRDASRLDEKHAVMKPSKKKSYGGGLETPFFPLVSSDAKRAFKIYTVRRNRKIVDDYRPLPLYWKPKHAPHLVKRGTIMFDPNIRIGEYTQYQIQLQLEKLAYHWHFFQVDDEDLQTLLAALLLRTAEIVCHKFISKDHVLDMGNEYDDHEVWQGMTVSAESRSTTKQIVANPDGSISYEDSPLVKTMKKQFNQFQSTIKQVSVKFILEVGGIFRCMYKDILFFTENISSRIKRTEVCKIKLERALFQLLKESLQLEELSIDAHTKQKIHRYYGIQNHYGDDDGDDDIDHASDKSIYEIADYVRKETYYMDTDDRDSDNDDDDDGYAGMGHRATPKQMEKFKEIIRETIMVEIRNKRDTSFIQKLLKRIRVDHVPHGSREQYASNNEGIMNSTAMVQEQECSPAEMLAHRRNVWPVLGLDYFMERVFSPRIHSRVACSIFQSILYTMDSAYVWNDKERMEEITQADFRPCVIYDSSRDIELDSHTSLEIVPRIVIIMNSFFVVYNNEFFYLKNGNIFDAIVYWILLFAENKFTRVLGQVEKKWKGFEYWIQHMLQQNTEAFIAAQLQDL